ncbi:FAD/NAD(P)-binding protein [Mycolicibacterium rufum]|uniref:FAD/NAD(P)-binding protein n=2 Tax=Mycolicibacterium rufum TaxID=318424 RepID=A0ABY3ULY8_9MYCO|nr:FAD/NAD(P)-binding protein [Mycolicibacterium rufum]KGI67530.1 hypothetical protein EU78_08850 [Mycolicibacterium rufum]ULP38491.1 FAD/NAD(P)-binding protein [Mycolicibacterium rufum]
MPTPACIAVLGGGFSGAMTAVNVARLSDRPMHIVVVDDRGSVGRGVAYSVRRPEYLLNVAARNMSAFRDEPDHFLRWLRTRAEFDPLPDAELSEQFVPRQVYGDYLRSIVENHLCGAGHRPCVSTELVTGEAVDIEPGDGHGVIRMADGARIAAEKIVLATGNEPPAPLPGAGAHDDHPAWVANPWRQWEHRLPDTGSIAILGTGLTAVDAIITLGDLGWRGSIHAISRHGWLPQPHFRGVEYPEFPPAGIDLTELGLDALRRLVSAHCAELVARDADPAIVVDKLRPYTQRIWSRFSREERLEFARRDAARWNVLRHRIAPEIHDQVEQARRAGVLTVHAGSIGQVQAVGEKIRICVEAQQPVVADLVINATGPSTRFSATRSVLLRNLLTRGMVSPDDTDMGIRVDRDHTVLTCRGDRSAWLLALGPTLRGTYWETIAVPELRVQAQRVAETLLGTVPADVEEEGQLRLEHML